MPLFGRPDGHNSRSLGPRLLAGAQGSPSPASPRRSSCMRICTEALGTLRDDTHGSSARAFQKSVNHSLG